MYSNDYEEAFDCFLQRKEYDEAESALFSIVRIAFYAGWKAAGGEKPQPQHIFEVVLGTATDSEDGT